MSGFNARRPGTFELTATKAEHWHRTCRCGRTLHGIVTEHLWQAGFRTVASGEHWVRLEGPGLANQSTDALYAACRGDA